MAAISITAASVLPSADAVQKQYTAGATITAGQPVYFDSATSTVKLADADNASAYAVIGIATNGASSGQPVTVCVQDPGFTLGGTIAKGDVIIVHTTAGSVCKVVPGSSEPTTGWYVSVLGVGISTTKINLFPVASCRADVAI